MADPLRFALVDPVVLRLECIRCGRSFLVQSAGESTGDMPGNHGETEADPWRSSDVDPYYSPIPIQQPPQ